MLWTQGDSGEDVRLIQSYLGFLGFYQGDQHGQFDEQTVVAVRAFEKSEVDYHGAKFEDDGFVGDLTWKSLMLRAGEKVYQAAQDLRALQAELDLTKQDLRSEVSQSQNLISDTSAVVRSEVDGIKREVITATRSELDQVKQSVIEQAQERAIAAINQAQQTAITAARSSIDQAIQTAIDGARATLDQNKFAAINDVRVTLEQSKQTAVNNAFSKIDEAKQAAITLVQSEADQAKQRAVTEIDQTKQQIIQTAKSEVDQAKQSAKSELDQIKQSAKSEVAQAVQSATSDLDQSKQTAQSAIEQSKQNALDQAKSEVEIAKQKAVEAAKEEVQKAANAADRALKEDNDAALQAAIAQREASKARASAAMAKTREFARVSMVKLAEAEATNRRVQAIAIEIAGFTAKRSDDPDMIKISAKSRRTSDPLPESLKIAKDQLDALSTALAAVEKQEQSVQAAADVAPVADNDGAMKDAADKAKEAANQAQKIAQAAKQAADAAEAQAKQAHNAYQEVMTNTQKIIDAEPQMIEYRKEVEQVITPIGQNPNEVPIEPHTWDSIEDLFFDQIPTSPQPEKPQQPDVTDELQFPTWHELKQMFNLVGTAKK